MSKSMGSTDCARFFTVLAREYPKASESAITDAGVGLIYCATRQARIALKLCNGDITQESFDRRRRELEKLVGVIVRPLSDSVEVVFNNDPGGAALKLVLPSGRTNDFGGEGYCVPEDK